MTDQEKLTAVSNLSYRHASQFEDFLKRLLDDSDLDMDNYDVIKGIVRQSVALSKSQEIEREAIHKLVGVS